MEGATKDLETKLTQLEITRNKTGAVLQNSNRIRRHKDHALHAVVASVEKAKRKLEEFKISAAEDLTAIATWGYKLEEDISAVDLDIGKVSTILSELDRKDLEKVRKDQLDFERELFEKKLKYTKELETINSSNQTGNHTAEQNTTRAKLPKLTITKFSGTNLDWTRFWGQFSEGVHKSQMADITKFSYLKEFVDPKLKSGKPLKGCLLPPKVSRGGSRNFLKGGLYTIVVTFNANGVEGELRPRPLTRALKSSGAMPLPPL